MAVRFQERFTWLAEKIVRPSHLNDAMRHIQRILYWAFPQQIEGWYQDNPPATQAATAAVRFGGAAFASAYVPMRDGSLTGLLVKANANVTAGSFTATVYINGVATALTVSVTTGAIGTVFVAPGTILFVVGDSIEVYFATNGAYAPITLDWRSSIEVRT